MHDEEFWYIKLLNLKYRRGAPHNSDFLQNWSPQKFKNSEKGTPESSRMH